MNEHIDIYGFGEFMDQIFYGMKTYEEKFGRITELFISDKILSEIRKRNRDSCEFFNANFLFLGMKLRVSNDKENVVTYANDSNNTMNMKLLIPEVDKEWKDKHEKVLSEIDKKIEDLSKLDFNEMFKTIRIKK